MRSRGGWRLVLAGLFAALGSTAAPFSAEACSPAQPGPPIGLPRAGATDVSTASSIIVFTRGVPTGFTLQVGAQTVSLDAPFELGGGADALSGRGTFLRFRPATADGFLLPNTEHVLTAMLQTGPVEVTRFTTAAGYDKAEGTAPVLNAMHLWRVRYPVADISSGNCVFAEYHGFITVDYVPGSIPNTSADSVIHQFRLAPKNGGSAQTFVYTGDAPFTGHAPADAYPMPTGLWQPELDPTRPYCLTISAFGQGDIARLPVYSQSICAEVVQLSAAGAPPPPQIGGDISDDGGDSSDGGRAGGDAGSSTAGGGGCSLGGVTAAAGMPAGTLLLALVVVLCRRRHQASVT
ncbi:MAG: hypothetical protein ABJA82_13970 [Myxococcales bacterium]